MIGGMEHKVTGKSILVTGGTGFIGWHLVRRLSEMDNRIRVLARKTGNTQRLENIKDVTIIRGDLHDRGSLEAAADGIDVVYHLGAKLHVPMDSRDPELHSVNVDGTKNLLDACISRGVPQFIFFSSAAVMLGNICNVMDEKTPCNPPTEYGRSKFKAEKLVRDYHERHGLVTTILRPVVVYGEGEKGNVVKFVESIQRRQFRIIGDGDTVRSLVYVQNVVEAALLVTGEKKANGETYILTDGDNITIKEMARLISSKLGVPVSEFHIPKGVAFSMAFCCELIERLFKFKVPFSRDLLKRLTTNQVCSSQKIQEELGFVPVGFIDGISRTIDSFERNW